MDLTTIESVNARVGTTLHDKWVLGQVIGAGGTAAVYEGTHRTNGKRVAVKVMHSFLASSEDVVARFQREGYIANKVGHPGAVTILDDDTTEDGAPFLVMDRLDGEPLARILDHATDGLAVGQVLSIANEVLDILAAAHAQGITHRDIKPDNVFLTTSGKIMLLDFGIARLREHMFGPTTGGADLTMRVAARTQDGSALGTPQYMPPEQARGRWNEVDAQSDIWSVGAMMFRLLTGKSVRVQRNAAEMLLAAMTERVPSVLTVGAVPPDVAAIVDKALQFEKRDRWPDAHAMQAAIREVAGRVGERAPEAKATLASMTTSTVRMSVAPIVPRRSSRPYLISAAVALVVFGGAFVLGPLGTGSSAAPAAATKPPESPATPSSSTTTGESHPPSHDLDLPAQPVESLEPVPLPKPASPAVHHWHRRTAHPPPTAPNEPNANPSSSPSPLDRRH